MEKIKEKTSVIFYNQNNSVGYKRSGKKETIKMFHTIVLPVFLIRNLSLLCSYKVLFHLVQNTNLEQRKVVVLPHTHRMMYPKILNIYFCLIFNVLS